ncbi:MAG TPA: ABC transporter ATP-binding protein [Candidatus Blautia pullicola]|uniref:ABC transporter ATP-binding protein n=1 Tax=Candidatus Blautia pullicola TaxID=2838498 RepID=A0A9D2JUX3_9FIRM|nr:ABC transporter ATP-binding protein [Candidatus Blautia pullicola]
MEILRTKGLKKYFENQSCQVRALDGVELSIEEGEFVALIGSSGCGKTTLLNMLGGLDTPTEGQVYIRGKNLSEMSREERTIFRRRNVGFVFQQFNLVPILNVYDNILLPLRLDGAEPDEAYLKKVVEALKLEEKLWQMPATLSGGQQQRAAIARALCARPAIILADEPTGNLDSKASMEVAGLLKTCAYTFHQTVVMVTHDEEMAQMADRILPMEDGRIVRKGEEDL